MDLLKPNLAAVVKAAQQVALRAEADRKRVRLQLVPAGVAAARGATAVELTPAGYNLFQSQKRYIVNHGGRGAGRSWDFARALIVRCYERPTRALLAREFMNSLADSAQQLVADQIAALGLSGFFDVQGNGIYGANGSSMVFAGLKTNVSKLKSAEGLDIVWIEEAEKISKNSWKTLIPTIRKRGSQIWVTFNPDLSSDPTYEMFVGKPHASAEVVKTDYRDNPWFAATTMPEEMEHLRSVDADAYAHVWLGGCRTHSDAQILRNKYRIESFTPVGGLWNGPYFGADWGFNDPTVLVKLWVHERRLYIEREAYATKCDIDRMPALFDQIPGSRQHVIRGDNARPETVNYLKQHGFPRIESCEKWKGSVEDGVAHLRSYEEIIIHPSCEHTAQEARLYSYKVDQLSGDVLPDIKPGNDHCIDSARYGLQPLIRRNGAGAFLGWLQKEVDKLPKAPSPLPFAVPGAKVDPI